MKYCKAVIILFVFNMYACDVAFCQNQGQENPNGDIRKDTAAKRSFFSAIIEGIAGGLEQRTVPTEKNARIAYEFKRARIYPSSDALDLIYILNPWLETAQDIPQGTNLKMPAYPWLTGGLKRRVKEEYLTGSKPDSRTNEVFDSLTNIFNDNVENFEERYRNFIKDNNGENSVNPQSFLDTLNLFTKSLLPTLKATSAGICKSKMQYFNDNLIDLAENVQNNEITDNSAFIILSIIQDFFSTNVRSNASSLFKTFSSHSLYYTVSFPTHTINEEDKEDNGVNGMASSGENRALKCRVYIYDMQGNVIMGRFRVYFAPYVTIYNLENCKNVVECLLNKTGTRDAGPASTAFASIANNSNWAIYCEDIDNKNTYRVNEKYNYQNIVDKDESDNSSFKILIIYHGN